MLRQVCVRAYGDDLAAAVPVELQNGLPVGNGPAAVGVYLNAAAALHHLAQDRADRLPVTLQRDWGVHVPQRVDDMPQHIVQIGAGQNGHGGKIVVQGGIAGVRVRIINKIEIAPAARGA